MKVILFLLGLCLLTVSWPNIKKPFRQNSNPTPIYYDDFDSESINYESDGDNQQPPQDGGNQPPMNGNNQLPPPQHGENQPPMNGNNQLPPPQHGENQQPPQDGENNLQ